MSERSDHQRPAEPNRLNRSLSEAEPFLRGIVANGILLLLASGVEDLFFGRGYFASLVQHPFWIIVLLAAMQGGLYIGVATAGLAALMMDWPPRPIGMDITAHFIEVAILPLQWLFAALCIGLFRQTDLRKAEALRRDLARLADQNDLLAREILRADATRMQLELQLVTMPREAGSPTGVVVALTDHRDAAQARQQSAGSRLKPGNPSRRGGKSGD